MDYSNPWQAAGQSAMGLLQRSPWGRQQSRPPMGQASGAFQAGQMPPWMSRPTMPGGMPRPQPGGFTAPSPAGQIAPPNNPGGPPPMSAPMTPPPMPPVAPMANMFAAPAGQTAPMTPPPGAPPMNAPMAPPSPMGAPPPGMPPASPWASYGLAQSGGAVAAPAGQIAKPQGNNLAGMLQSGGFMSGAH